MSLLAKKNKQDSSSFDSDTDKNYFDCEYCGVDLPHCHCKCPYCGERDKCECALFDAATGG